jgi:hypothetical protein
MSNPLHQPIREDIGARPPQETRRKIRHCKDCAHQLVENTGPKSSVRYICSSSDANKSNTAWLIHGRDCDFLDCDQARSVNGSCRSTGSYWKKKD